MSLSPLLLLMISPALMTGHVAQGEAEYLLTILPSLDGGTRARGIDINDAGTIVGISNTMGGSYAHAVRWDSSTITDLTGLGISPTQASGINSAGVIVGVSDEFGINAFQWENGAVHPLEMPGSCCSEANAINDTGMICGNVPLHGIGTRTATIWIEGTWHLLLDPADPRSSFAKDLNNLGQVTGMFTNDAGQYRGYVWEDGIATALPVPEGFSGNINALGINSHATVVGYGDGQAMQWSNGSVQELETLSGGMFNYAHDINDSGVVVGHSYGDSFGGLHACRWIGGVPQDLNEFIDDTVWTLRRAFAINAHGQIVGEAIRDGGSTSAFLLTPINTPCPGDVSGDGAINITDLLAVIDQWGSCDDDCSADFDGDGTVGVTDLLIVLDAWGPCP